MGTQVTARQLVIEGVDTGRVDLETFESDVVLTIKVKVSVRSWPSYVNEDDITNGAIAIRRDTHNEDVQNAIKDTVQAVTTAWERYGNIKREVTETGARYSAVRRVKARPQVVRDAEGRLAHPYLKRDDN